MRRPGFKLRRPYRRGLLALALAAAALATLALGTLGGAGGPARAGAQSAAGEPTPQTDDSGPAAGVTMIGATPAEAGAPGEDEAWGVGREGGEGGGTASVLVRYVRENPATREGGWSLGPAFEGASGQPLTGFKPDSPKSFEAGSAPSPLAGQLTPDGAGVMLGSVPRQGGGQRRVVLVRDPGGAFRQTAPVPAEGEEAPEPGEVKEGEAPLMKAGERIFAETRAPLAAPLDEGSGRAGALVVPVMETCPGDSECVEDGVLHWDGEAWTREPIAVPANSSTEFRVLAIGASSPSNAWLLARLSSKSSYPGGAAALFRRVRDGGVPGGWSWKPVVREAAEEAGAAEATPLTVPVAGSEEPFAVPDDGGVAPDVTSQVLTVTGEGVWIDGERSDVHASSTIFFRSEGEDRGRVSGSWCRLPESASPSTPRCEGELPEALPTGPSRSIAWANAADPFGERVITGLAAGVSLRLDGRSFTRVLALGGQRPPEGPGGDYGAAFANAREGWLGSAALPVHLTLEPAPSRLSPWPVPFSHPLAAIAPEPGAPVGALTSEALAVGVEGQVARYRPGVGWLPESLFGPGERVANPPPHLRAVAWPTPARAYAVGDEGQMWLWRGETGLWEPDPATPLNFRGNLLGVAFDPTNPTRGYAVGPGGVLLRYGKTWAQEPPQALPAQVQGAAFTSIAFAGSEALVVYRKLPDPTEQRYEGGLLVNDGSGWQIDQEAAAAIGSQEPDTVAGLPDGGAAFAANEDGGLTHVYERQAEGGPWQQDPSPLSRAPGMLALFREGGALRAVTAGQPGSGYGAEGVTPAPPGSPPNYIAPYGPHGGGVLRQTATGWSDEQHELDNEGKNQPGADWRFEDKVYEPDPIYAVLIDPTGAQGWAVGGEGETGTQHSSSDVERYPADGSVPSGAGSSAVTVDSSHEAVFAVGGGAQCEAPCSDLADARIGPDVWLSTALQHAHEINGVRAFLYTGPRVTAGETEGPASQPIPYAREMARYEQLLAASPIPAFAAISPSELDARPLSDGTESTFEQAFEGLEQPLGLGAPAEGITPAPNGNLREGGRTLCAQTPGCQGAYYAFDSGGPAGSVRAIVLDDGSGVGTEELEWLAGQLEEAAADRYPAIVIGSADLGAELKAGDAQAQALVQTLLSDGASAYFYDAPQENVTEQLQIGSQSIPAFGSGTLGYVSSSAAEDQSDFHGASGFLLAEVDTAAYDPSTHRAPVSAGRLIPDIGELALEAKDGILLRRSEVALFQGLARRPRAGGNSEVNSGLPSQTGLYIPIPSNCLGPACPPAGNGILPEYSFSSSNEEIGQFVEPNLAIHESHAVLQGPTGKPIPDSASGLFCAYNAGTTTVTISSGGLSASLPVTVQPGSVRQPCGTVPAKPRAAADTPISPPPPPPPPAGAGPVAPASAPPPVPLPAPPLIAPVPPVRLSVPKPPPFVPLAAPAAPLLAFVPPPVPTPARPTPPSGTSAVTSPVEAAEKEEEQEEATESVSNQAMAYRTSEHEPWPAYLLGVVVLAAFAGASARGGRRGRRGEVRVAPATVSAMRAQRRNSRPRRP